MLCSLWKSYPGLAFRGFFLSHTGAAHRQRVSVQQSGQRHPLLQAGHQTGHPLPRALCGSVLFLDLVTELCFSSIIKGWANKMALLASERPVQDFYFQGY